VSRKHVAETKLRIRLRERRTALGLTTRELAAKAGCSQSAIAGYELGVRAPTGGILVRLAVALGVDTMWLLGGEEFDQAHPGEVPNGWAPVVGECIALNLSPDDVRLAVQSYMMIRHGLQR